MSDFEVHPVGTLKRIEDLEFELAIFRKAESELTDAIADKAALEIKINLEVL